jgi:hypothetical protein
MSEEIILPSELSEPTPPYDVTVITCLRSGRHLVYNTRIQEGDDPARIAQSHCLVRGLYNADAERFVIVHATGRVETLEAGR